VTFRDAPPIVVLFAGLHRRCPQRRNTLPQPVPVRFNIHNLASCPKSERLYRRPGALIASVQYGPTHIKTSQTLAIRGLSAAASHRKPSLHCLRLTDTQALSLSRNRTQFAPRDHILKKSAYRCPAETPTPEVALPENYFRRANSQH
jgi:hypothetical protein